VKGTLKAQLLELLVLSSDAIVYARKPWHEDSESLLVVLTEGETPTAALAKEGYAYVLGTGTAQEVVEVFKGREPSEEETWRLLIHYAQFDAFPEWVFEDTGGQSDREVS
jgi:hypothetical protein